VANIGGSRPFKAAPCAHNRIVRILFLLATTFLPAQFLLPDDIIPKKHIIELTIDPSLNTFTGWAKIEVDLTKPTSLLQVNAKDLQPLESSVSWQGRKILVQASAAAETISLSLPSEIGPGPATISIRYQAKLDEKAVAGPYRNKVASDWYAFTTFTPIDARRAFPCFDEPRFKTPWELSIHIKRSDKAFSNARQVSETNEPNGMKLVRFAPTVPLPAEVVAFCVGPFDVYQGAPAGHGTPIRVISAKGHREQSKAAAEATVAVLPRLEAYTGIPYPYGKLDYVAVPEFKFGAVENPGLITYKASTLLLSPARIRSLQAHEMAHLWFGDLVTQATWDDVWLSEGFATWFSAKIMDEEQPPSRRLLASVAARERIMITDAKRPVRVPINSRKDADNVYSQIVYQKGAAILVMLDGWLGETQVRDGLREYLKAHKFGNATTADLESSLEGSKPVLDSFLNQTGIPAIRAECKDAHLALDQTNSTHNWTVPVCWRGQGIASSCIVLTSRSEIQLKSCPAWIYLNANGTGYYRTEWSPEQLSTLDLTKLTAAERLTLIYDLRASKNITSPLLKTLTTDPEPEIAKAAMGK